MRRTVSEIETVVFGDVAQKVHHSEIETVI